ncbi:hypothetical protein L9F63_022990, partial [Diploptera punctata]
MIYTLYGFAIFFFVFWCGKWLVHLAAIFYGKWKLHKKLSQQSCEIPYPGVSILKPLMGVDPNLFSNLETFFTMNYPVYELLFCVEDKSDPAVMVVMQLMENWNNLEQNISSVILLYVGGSNVGVNPKINNMQPGFIAAKYDLILISDSGIRMKEDTLLDMVSCMTEDVGLVHQMPFTCDRDGFAATLGSAFLSRCPSSMILCPHQLSRDCRQQPGMSALMAKIPHSTKWGKFKHFSLLLLGAEDFFLAKSNHHGKILVVCGNQPVCQARLTRWAKLRVAMVPHTILLEPLSECMVIGACASWAVSFLFKWDPLVFYLVHILVWFLLDWILLSIIQ